MKTNSMNRRGFTLVELLVVIVIIAALAGLSAPMVMKQVRKADQTEAINNAKQIGLGLFEFSQEYGAFPDAITNPLVTANAGAGATVPIDETNADGYFRQLIAAGIVQSEEIFYAKVQGSRKPDGQMGASALQAGENGFGYILGSATAAQSPSGNPSRVVAVTPMLTATTFDPDPFADYAVALRLDNSVKSYRINAAGLPVLGGGVTLLQVGAETIWGTTVTPTIVPPGTI